MNVIFFGTPEFAKDFLVALEEDRDIFVSAVVTRSDKRVGRKQVLTPAPTKIYAAENKIPVFQPDKLSDPKFIKQMQKLKPDIFVVIAYGKLIPQKALDIPRLGTINVHPSKLPKYRGPSPMQAAILAGDDETAVSIMQVDAEMDHGPVLKQGLIKLAKNESIASLTKKVVKVGIPLLIEALHETIEGTAKPIEQDHEQATFCKMISKDDGRVNWSRPADEIERQFRAYTLWPGIWTKLDGKTIKLHSILPLPEGELEGVGALEPGQISTSNKRILVGTKSNPIQILELQPEGKQPMDAKSFLNGNQDLDGKTFK